MDFTWEPTPELYKWLKVAAKMSDQARRWWIEHMEQILAMLGVELSEEEIAQEIFVMENGNAARLLRELFGV